MSELLSRRDETSDMKFVTTPPWGNYALFLPGRFSASPPLHTSPPLNLAVPAEKEILSLSCTVKKDGT